MQTFNAFAKAPEPRGAIEGILSFRVVTISPVGVGYWAAEVVEMRCTSSLEPCRFGGTMRTRFGLRETKETYRVQLSHQKQPLFRHNLAMLFISCNQPPTFITSFLITLSLITKYPSYDDEGYNEGPRDGERARTHIRTGERIGQILRSLAGTIL